MNQKFVVSLFFKNLTTIAGILSGVWMMTACGSQSDPARDTGTVKTPVSVTTIETGEAKEWVELNAVSSFLIKNSIKSTISGMVESVAIAPGDIIRRGQELFTLRTREASALSKFQATDSLSGFRGVVPVFAVRQGVVSSVNHQRGDYIADGEELAVISEPSSLIFLLQVPFEYRQYIHKGESCEIFVPGERKLSGMITGEMPSMDIQSQTENYIVKPDTHEFLPENLIARVKIVKTVHPHALLLPKTAILTDETQMHFWVMQLMNDSVAVKVPVKTGIETDHRVEILNPVFSPADRILVQGNYGLPDTALVSVQK